MTTSSRNLSFLMYDIPEVSELSNPSARLRRCGVRINLSCWVVPTDNLPHALLLELAEGGATWHTAPFADQAGENLGRMAATMLGKEIEETAKRLQESMERYGDQLDADLEEGETAEKRAKAYQTKCRAAIRRLERLMDSAAVGAAAIGLDPEVVRFAGIRNVANSLRSAAHVRAAAYVNAVSRIDDDNPLAAVAKEDAGLPAYVVADVLEEQGEDASDLRDTFAGKVPAAAPAAAVEPAALATSLNHAAPSASAAKAAQTPAPAAPTVPAASGLVATYRGRQYRVEWVGSTRFGRRARLAFFDGSRNFWVNAADAGL